MTTKVGKKKMLVGWIRSDWRMSYLPCGRLYISLIHNEKNKKEYAQIGASKVRITIEEV